MTSVGSGVAATTPDEAGIEARAVALAGRWLEAARAAESGGERRRGRQLARLLEDPAGMRFTMTFVDRIMRAPTPALAAGQLRDLVTGQGAARFLHPLDRVLLDLGARLAPHLPRPVMALAERRTRALTGQLVIDADDPALRRHLARRRSDGVRSNLNRLGEAVLGEQEAQRRLQRTIELLGRDDVDYVSVKVSAIASRLNLWAFEATVERISERLRALYEAAAARNPPAFVNLDMEEYRDLDLTIAAFCRVLDEPPFAALDAGIVLQAYLPDAHGRLLELLDWAARRHAHHGSEIKIRIVKGANLAMERVDAELHGWPQAPLTTKAAVDANWKRMLDHALHVDRLRAVRIGVASHNLFDVAWAHLLAGDRAVSARVEFEMLEGMAPAQAVEVQGTTGGMLLYTPIVSDDEFASAVAYLFRRLEENAAPENFLRHLTDLRAGSARFTELAGEFAHSLAMSRQPPGGPRRTQDRRHEHPSGAPGVAEATFANEPDTDPALSANRAWMVDVVREAALRPPSPLVTDTASVDSVVARARRAAPAWAATPVAQRAAVLEAAAASLVRQRGALIATMVLEGDKVVGEADPEVSEAVDFARYYARRARELERLSGLRFAPLGVVVVTPPWNFPVAIPAGGMLAALAAGNTVIVKPPPETPACVELVVHCLHEAGVPADVLICLRTPDDDVGRHLVTHPGVDALLLTGAWETAELFRRWRPEVPLFAETSGKNAIVVTARADLDAAVADVVASAFGHAGQKCSAASLAIVEAALHDSEAFQRQLRDAVLSLVVGPADDLRSDVGPVIRPPGEGLTRALQRLDPGERWLVEPEARSTDGRLWRPGVRLGVRPGSWFHQTECFGPVLGVMRADDLRQATEWQNATPFGLTAGLWSLDEDEIRWWSEHVEAGSLYVNRKTTGAIVRRQPFGGWKRSVVGPGAKAGGPNYVAQFGRWSDDGLPLEDHRPAPAVRALLDGLLDDPDAGAVLHGSNWLRAAVHSDAWWWVHHFGRSQDPSALVSERNDFRYRALPAALLRVTAPAAARDGGADRDDRDDRDGDDPTVGRIARVVRLIAAGRCCGVPLSCSLDPALADDDPALRRILDACGLAWTVESEAELAARLDTTVAARIRLLGEAGDALRLAAAAQTIHIDAEVPVASGRIELPRWLREQSLSRTVHRYGNLLGADPRRADTAGAGRTDR